MKDIKSILTRIENDIEDHHELEYYWTHSARYQFILDKILKSHKNGKILDVGCYPYHIGKALGKLGFEVFGISSPHEPIEDKQNIKILNIETDKFPFKNEEFDLIIFTEVIEHLLNLKLPLKEIHRVLKKDGILIITTPNKISPFIAFRRIFLTNKNEKDHSSIYNAHNKEYSMGELTELLKRHGFKTKKSEHFISYTPFRKRKISDNFLVKVVKYLNYLFMEIFTPLKDTLYLEATKQL